MILPLLPPHPPHPPPWPPHILTTLALALTLAPYIFKSASISIIPLTTHSSPLHTTITTLQSTHLKLFPERVHCQSHPQKIWQVCSWCDGIFPHV